MPSLPKTINELFNAAVERYRDDEFLKHKVEGSWRSISFGEAASRVRELALGLYSLGIQPGERVAIWSDNRPEWNLADLAVLGIGAADVPIYTSQARAQVRHILNDSGVKAMFVSGSLLAEALELKREIFTLETVVSFDPVSEADRSSGAIAAVDLMNRGRELCAEKPGFYEDKWRAVGAEDLATLMYTSGTTGEPKGVMLTHKNLTSNVLQNYEWLSLNGRRDCALSYLPLSHIFERGVWYLYLYCGFVIAYAESVEAVPKNLLEIRPTVMTSVPRMFEKIYGKIVEKGLASGFPKKQIFLWSLGVARQWAELKDRKKPIGAWLSLEHKTADALVYKKWRDAVGGRVREFISGGAPLAPEIAYMFLGAGLTILQGYGLTETSPSITCNTEEHNRIGTVGRVIEGLEVRIAEDGEILVKGDSVTSGYYNLPEATAAALTPDGWFRTGDIGHLDEDGYLVITERKKELIKTSGGKYIAPQQIESLVKASRFVSQVVVVGDRRKYASALIVPNMALIRSYAELKGISYGTERELLDDGRVIDLLLRQVDEYTPQLARYEKIKRVALLAQEMTAESGELTPTLKPRRAIIEKNYRAVIDKLYEEEPAVVAAS